MGWTESIEVILILYLMDFSSKEDLSQLEGSWQELEAPARQTQSRDPLMQNFTCPENIISTHTGMKAQRKNPHHPQQLKIELHLRCQPV